MGCPTDLFRDLELSSIVFQDLFQIWYYCTLAIAAEHHHNESIFHHSNCIDWLIRNIQLPLDFTTLSIPVEYFLCYANWILQMTNSCNSLFRFMDKFWI